MTTAEQLSWTRLDTDSPKKGVEAGYAAMYGQIYDLGLEGLTCKLRLSTDEELS